LASFDKDYYYVPNLFINLNQIKIDENIEEVIRIPSNIYNPEYNIEHLFVSFKTIQILLVDLMYRTVRILRNNYLFI